MGKKVTHKILATPDGWQVENFVDGANRSSKRTKTYIGAKWYIWKYQRRLKRESPS